MVNIKEESWTLTNADTVAIPAGNRADGTVSKWSDIWKYQVPVGQSHVLKPEHKVSFYLASVVPAELGVGITRLKIVIRDQSEQDEKSVYGPSLYATCREFVDINKIARLGLANPIAVEERFFIVLQVYSSTAVIEANSYFKMETVRIRSTI